MANNTPPTGKQQSAESDRHQGMKDAGRNDRSDSSRRQAGWGSDDQQGGNTRSGKPDSGALQHDKH